MSTGEAYVVHVAGDTSAASTGTGSQGLQSGTILRPLVTVRSPGRAQVVTTVVSQASRLPRKQNC